MDGTMHVMRWQVLLAQTKRVPKSARLKMSELLKQTDDMLDEIFESVTA